jgi:hypothetical protein
MHKKFLHTHSKQCEREKMLPTEEKKIQNTFCVDRPELQTFSRCFTNIRNILSHSEERRALAVA